MAHVPFTQVQTSVIRDASLSREARLLYVELLSYAWQDAMTFVGQTRMADDLGCSDRSIRNWLRELEIRGLVETDQRRGKSNRYRVPVVCENPGNVVPVNPGNVVPTTNTHGTNKQSVSRRPLSKGPRPLAEILRPGAW